MLAQASSVAMAELKAPMHAVDSGWTCSRQLADITAGSTWQFDIPRNGTRSSSLLKPVIYRQLPARGMIGRLASVAMTHYVRRERGERGERAGGRT